jgi:ribosomal protein S18 acetylase RimI-like enzyme
VDSSKVRPALDADLEGLTGLMLEQLREHEIAVDEERLRGSIREVLQRPDRGFFLVAVDETGRLVGAAYVPFLWSLEHAGPVAWLEELYVSPPARQAGLGTALVRAACAEAAARGCRAMDLEVEASHQRAAGLYRREGFLPLSRSRWVRLL